MTSILFFFARKINANCISHFRKRKKKEKSPFDFPGLDSDWKLRVRRWRGAGGGRRGGHHGRGWRLGLYHLQPIWSGHSTYPSNTSSSPHSPPSWWSSQTDLTRMEILERPGRALPSGRAPHGIMISDASKCKRRVSPCQLWHCWLSESTCSNSRWRVSSRDPITDYPSLRVITVINHSTRSTSQFQLSNFSDRWCYRDLT